MKSPTIFYFLKSSQNWGREKTFSIDLLSNMTTLPAQSLRLGARQSQDVVISSNIPIGKGFLLSPQTPEILCEYITRYPFNCLLEAGMTKSKLCICTESLGYGAIRKIVPGEIVRQNYKMRLQAHKEEAKRLEPVLYISTTYFPENNLTPPHVLPTLSHKVELVLKVLRRRLLC